MGIFAVDVTLKMGGTENVVFGSFPFAICCRAVWEIRPRNKTFFSSYFGLVQLGMMFSAIALRMVFLLSATWVDASGPVDRPAAFFRNHTGVVTFAVSPGLVFLSAMFHRTNSHFESPLASDVIMVT
jgi:hypothetical protein